MFAIGKHKTFFNRERLNKLHKKWGISTCNCYVNMSNLSETFKNSGLYNLKIIV